MSGSRVAPTVDDHQDITVTLLEQVEGQTTMAFTRARVTGDPSPVDVPLDHPVHILWAYGSADLVHFETQSIFYHGINRGSTYDKISLPSAEQCPFHGTIKACFVWCVYACMYSE